MGRVIDNRNGVKSFLVSPQAIKTTGEVFFRSNLDCGAQYLASLPENVYRLGRPCSGSCLSITVANKGSESVVKIIPDDEWQICWGGLSVRGQPLVNRNAKSGDFVKIATFDGSITFRESP